MNKDSAYTNIDFDLLNEQIYENHLELVKAKQDWYSLLVLEYVKENDILLNEGVFDKIKDMYKSAVRGYKRASLEKGGKIIGKTEAAEKAKSEFSKTVANLAKNTVTKALIPQINKIAPDFPNTDEGPTNSKGEQEFRAALSSIGQIYDSIYVAAQKKPEEQGYLDPLSANALIKTLRDYVKYYLDYQLGDHYKHFLKEQEELGQGEQFVMSRQSQKDDVKHSDEAAAIKGLKSNKAPLILAALGGLGTGFGWLVKQPWFLQYFKNPQTFARVIEPIIKGETQGVTQHLATLSGQGGQNISGMKVVDFFAKMKTNGLVDAAGNPTSNLLQLAKDAGNNNFADWWATNLAGPAHAQQTLAQAIPLSGAGAPGAGGDIFTKKIIGFVAKKVATGAAGGTLSAAGSTMVNLGPLATTLGIGLIAAGAAVKALRMKGKVSSRAALMGVLLNQMQDVDVAKAEESGVKEPEPTKEKEKISEPQTGGKEPVFYIKKSGGNTLRRTSLNTWLTRQLSEPMANMQLSAKQSRALVNGIVKIAYDSLKGQGATIQEARYGFDPSKAKPFLGGGAEKQTQKEKNTNKNLDLLLNKLIEISKSDDDLQTKINKWYKTYSDAAKIYQNISNKKVDISGINKLLRSIDDAVKYYDYPQKGPKGITANNFLQYISRLGEPQEGDNLLSTRTRRSINNILDSEWKKQTKQTDKNSLVDTSDYPVDTLKSSHKFSVPVSDIQKFIRDYYQKNAPESAKKDETLMGQNLSNLGGEVLSLIRKWIKYQTSTSQEQLKGKKDSEERIKKAKETLGINESQISRWKQMAGIIKG